MTKLAALVLASLLATGCKSKAAKTCEAYVDIAMRCDHDIHGMNDDERGQTRGLMYGICTEAFRGDTQGTTGETKRMVLETYAHVTAAATCEAKATTCAERQRCEDELKPNDRFAR